MSISFSGLATGLDTSSWVQSLTALKRAKVETLQSQKDNIITKQETLSGIKNFFNSFRSVIQRVTDVKFGIKTSDIFSKNLAISSNANILTAVASNEAQNGTYNIEVERLATNTKASSGYSTGVTLTVTSTATLDTGLNLLGAKSGKIGVDVGGVEKIINITKDETLDTFTKKLNNIGLKARYDLQIGRYFLDMSLSDIRDIDGTGIVNALHLKGVNEGYKSGLLQTKETETVYETANGNTKLSDLGIQNGTIQVSADSSGTPKLITIDNSKTISDFITSLQTNGFDASISSDGYFQLNNANIVSDGATGLLNAFGWENSEITSASQTSKELSYTTVISASHTADSGTLLNEISGIRVNNGDTIVLRNNKNQVSTISLTITSTIGDVLDGINAAGMNAAISDGIISISNGQVLDTGSLDINSLFNMQDEISYAPVTSDNLYANKYNPNNVTGSSPLTYTTRVILDSVLGSASDEDLGASTAYKTVYSNTTSDTQNCKITHTADTSTTLSKLGFSGSEEQVIRTNDNNLATITVSSSTTIKQLQDSYKKYGINLALDYSSKASITHDANSGCIVSGYEKTFAALKLNSKPCTASTVKLDETSTDIKIRDIVNSEGNALIGSSPVLMYAPGGIITINPDDTIESVIDKFAVSGITMTLDNNGRFNFSGETNFSFNNSAFANALGVANQGFQQTVYKSSPLMTTGSSSQKVKASNGTKLSALGVTSGEYLLYNNGRKNTLSVSANDTIGDFINTLQSYGLEAALLDNGTYSILKTNANSNIYLAASTTAGKSNIIEKLFDDAIVVSSNSYRGKPQVESAVTKNVKADENTLLSKFDGNGKKAAGTLNIKVDNSDLVVNISDGETFGSLINKLNSIGINASMKDGYFTIESAYKNIAITGGTSKILDTLKMSYSPDLGSYSATDPNNPLVVTEITEKVQNGSPANYLSMDTKLSLLNISEGTLSVYRDGKRTVLNINPDYTVRDINSLLSDINVSISDGYLKFHADGAEIVVGSTSDTSNFAAITGMNTNSEGDAVSSRVLYCVNGESKVMTSGLFVKGNVTEGDFIVGNAKILIDSNTTLNDIIAQINYNDASNATAYWDSITGCLYIKSKVSGAALINIEAGTSNFTDIMGFTLEGAKLNTKGQELGQNAVFTINGIRHTSASNTVSGDVSGIEGVTINLKDVSNGEPIVLTIEKDKESAADAISDIIDAYNELIENVDKEIARDGKLNNETTLKALRNQIRSLFTGFYPNAGTFKSGASVGITFAPASVNNIRTDNINQLKFDRDKFINAFMADNNSVKQLLIGDETEKGILVKVEDVLNQALGAVTGYFASAERSYSGKISRMDAKIERANLSADRYKASLEKKFSAMETIISKLQNNYSSFLS